MERWQNKVAVVTGASAGIGCAIVKDLIRNGLQVVGLARRVELVEDIRKDLSAIQQNKLTAIKCDVSDVNSVNEAFDQIINKFGGVDILVNNAGCLRTGPLVTTDINVIQSVLQTNVMGIVHCTQRAFKSMKERNFAGHVVLINSIAGHLPGSLSGAPNINIYSPSKFAITAMAEIYRQEFSDQFNTQIKVTSISPGAVETEILPAHMRSIHGEHALKSEDVSAAVMFVISTPPHVQVHEMIIRPLGAAQ